MSQSQYNESDFKKEDFEKFKSEIDIVNKRNRAKMTVWQKFCEFVSKIFNSGKNENPCLNMKIKYQTTLVLYRDDLLPIFKKFPIERIVIDMFKRIDENENLLSKEIATSYVVLFIDDCNIKVLKNRFGLKATVVLNDFQKDAYILKDSQR